MSDPHPNADPLPATIACPRCGYDLSGTPASWTTSCPLDGTCSECGEPLLWNDLLGDHISRLRGFIEHARTPAQHVRYALTTLLWIAAPHRFWQRITTRYSFRPRPILIITTACLLLCIIATLAASQAILVYANYRRGFAATSMLPAPLTTTLSSIRTITFATYTPTRSSPLLAARSLLSFSGLSGTLLAWPMLFSLLPGIRHRANLHWSHLARAAALQCWPLLLYLCLALFLHATSKSLLTLAIMGPLTNATSIIPTLTTLSAFAADLGVPLMLLALHLWIAAWWSAAIHTGWSLPRPTRLWGILCLASLTFGVAMHTLIETLLSLR
jgi:hypothetical protein